MTDFVQRFCPTCGVRGAGAFCPNDGTAMKPLVEEKAGLPRRPVSPPAAPPSPSPLYSVALPQYQAAQPYQAPAPKSRSSRKAVLAVGALVVAGLVVAGLFWANSQRLQSGNNSANCPQGQTWDGSQCVLPATMVLLDLAGYSLSADAGEGFGCRESGTAGCQLNSRYTSFRIQWSASALLELEVGTQETSCRWLSMGGGSYCGNYEAAQTSGNRLINADWEFYGNIWFHYGDATHYPDISGVTIYQLTITAHLS